MTPRCKQLVPVQRPTRKQPGRFAKLHVSKSTFPFFDLPREIRDQIYDEVWKNRMPFSVYHGLFNFSVIYEGRGDSTSHTTPSRTSDLPWVVVNKQFKYEAIEQFQRKATWKLIADLTFTWGTKDAQILELGPIPVNYGEYALTNTGKSQTTLLLCPWWADFLEEWRRSSGRPIYWKLKLSVTMSYTYPGYLSGMRYIGNVPAVADLWPLSYLATTNLRYVELVFASGSSSVVNSTVGRLDSHLETIVQNELIRVGTVLVGGKAKVGSTVMLGSTPTIKFEFQRA